ncbi:hypothetical protein PINS_up016828 [Pythium insidiosum]|nr:hypothetical protein PINS_up016828 [Pythium insidiosum]
MPADAPALPDTASLCEFLRDGRALCLLANALLADCGAEAVEAHALPKKLERSMHQLSTFHALERIQFFIRWCRSSAVRLEEQHIFTSVQLLDEANTDAVVACVDALRMRFRPKFDAAEKPTVASPLETEEEEDETAENSASFASTSTARRSSAHSRSTRDSYATNDSIVSASSVDSATQRPPSSSRLNAFLSQFPVEATAAPTDERPAIRHQTAFVVEQPRTRSLGTARPPSRALLRPLAPSPSSSCRQRSVAPPRRRRLSL